MPAQVTPPFPLPWTVLVSTGPNFIAYAEFTYEHVFLPTLKLAFAMASGRTRFGRESSSAFLSVMYDARGEYDRIIQSRHDSACVGLGNIVPGGYASPIGTLVREQCSAAANVATVLYDAIMLAAIDAPMLSCVCKLAGQSDFHRQAMDKCLPSAPNKMRSALISMILFDERVQGPNVRDTCDVLLFDLETKLQTLPRRVIQPSYRAANALGSALEYVVQLVLGNTRAPMCNNFRTSPFVVAMIPQPVEHFRMCGYTTSCRSKCAGEIDLFEDARRRQVALARRDPITALRAVESPFFSRFTDASVTRLQILAMIEHDSWSGRESRSFNCHECGYSEGMRCFSVSGIPFTTTGFADVEVHKYCLPSATSEDLYEPSDSNGFWVTSDGDVDTKSYLLSRNGHLAHVSFSMPSGAFLFVMTHVAQESDEGTRQRQTIFAWYQSPSNLRAGEQRRVLDSESLVFDCGIRQELGLSSYQQVDYVAIERFFSAIPDRADTDAVLLVDVALTMKTYSDYDWSLESTETFDLFLRVAWCRDSVACPQDSRCKILAVPDREATREAGDPAQEQKLDPRKVATWSSGGVRALFDFWLFYYIPVWSPVDSGVYVMLPSADSGAVSSSGTTQRRDRSFFFAIRDRAPFLDIDDFGRWSLRTVEDTDGGVLSSVPIGNTDRPRHDMAELLGSGLAWMPMYTSNGDLPVEPRTSQVASGLGFLMERDPALESLRGSVCSVASSAAAVSWLSTNPSSMRSHWLKEVCVDAASGGLKLRRSQPVETEVEVPFQCDHMDCSGCASLRLRQLCMAAQSCSVAQCVGTAVNQQSAFCATGMVLQEAYEGAVIAGEGAYMALSETMMTIVRFSVDRQPGAAAGVSIAWPSDVLNSAICTAKDVTAHAVTVVTSLINGVNLLVNDIAPVRAERNVGALSPELVAEMAELLGKPEDDPVLLRFLEDVSVYSAAAKCGGEPLSVDTEMCFALELVEHKLQLSAAEAGRRHVSVRGPGALAKVGPTLDAESTLQMSSLGQLIYQLYLAGPYILIAAERSLMCIVRMLVEDPSAGLGFRVSFQDVAGREGSCLAGHYERSAKEGSDEQRLDTALVQGGAVVAGVMKAGSVSGFAILSATQIIDAAMSWLSGVVTGVQDMIYTFDTANCRMPNYRVKDTLRCPCGDEGFRIDPARRAEGPADGAFWCAGTLLLTRYDGTQGVVFNPFSLDQISAKLHRDPRRTPELYLACLSNTTDPGECDSKLPRIREFEAAGVPSMSVWSRCKANYAAKQWDIGATLLFNESIVSDRDSDAVRLQSISTIRMVHAQAMSWVTKVDDNLLSCMSSAGQSPQACRDIAFASPRVGTQTGSFVDEVPDAQETFYFSYARQADPDGEVDSCRTFTGPARHAGTAEARAQFSACLGDAVGYSAPGQAAPRACEIPLIATRGTRSTRIDVASLHRRMDSTGKEREALAARMHEEALDKVRAFISEVESDAHLDSIEVDLFSAEGDMLHQMVDCVFLGPHSSVDYLPTSSDGALPSLQYFRDNATGASRLFDLPCAGDKLKGDTRPPFTCGSPGRRAVIKYYIRDILASSAGSHKAKVQQLIKDFISRLADRWSNTSNFFCPPPGSSAPEFADASPSHCGDAVLNAELYSGYDPALPSFFEVPSVDVVASLLDNVDLLYNRSMVDSEVWTKYMDEDARKAFAGVPRDPAAYEQQLFKTSRPIVSYGVDGAAQSLVYAPLGLYDEELQRAHDSQRGRPVDPLARRAEDSVWGFCTGLLSQSLFTIPLTNEPDSAAADGSPGDDAEDPLWWTPPYVRERVRAGRPYEPTADSLLETTEQFIAELTAQALELSPLYRHYVTRHTPSKSLVCEDYVEDAIDAGFEYGQSGPLGAAPLSDVHLDVEGTPGRVESSVVWTGEDWANSAEEGRPALPIYGFSSMPLGAVNRICPCDPHPTAGELCHMPASICPGFNPWAAELHPVLHSSCEAFLAGPVGALPSYPREHAAVAMAELHDPSVGLEAVRCEELAPSDLWGVFPHTDASAAFNWDNPAALRAMLESGNVQVDTHDLLVEGKAGLFAGNIGWVNRSFSSIITPASRKRLPVVANRTEGVLRRSTQARCRPGSLTPEDLSTRVVQELFPVAQGVRESAATAACIRYVIELARLQVLRTVAPLDAERSRLLVAQWRSRCASKARQMASCVSSRAFDIEPEFRVWADIAADRCPFRLNSDFEARTYLTSTCVIHRGATGRLYDGYRCAEHAQDPRVLTPSDVTDARCGVMHDPRDMVRLDTGTWARFASSGGAHQGGAQEGLDDVLRKIAEERGQSSTPGSEPALPLELNHEWVLDIIDPDRSVRGFLANTADGTDWRFAEGGKTERSPQCVGLARP